jgi:hypothetical protein
MVRGTVIDRLCLILMRTIRSQSRMRGDYLFYEEKVETTQEERDAKAARRYVTLANHTASFNHCQGATIIRSIGHHTTANT